MGDSSDDSEGYERPVPRCKCDKQVEFVCEACQRSLCKSCVGEHVADRKSGSHDVKYHHSFRGKIKKEAKNHPVPVAKCVIDGWKMSGKTSMIKAYIDGACPDFKTVLPTTHEVHSVRVSHQGRELCIQMYDLPTSEWYDDLRKLILRETYDVFILCIPIDFVNLENESKFFLKELHSSIPELPPIIVIATKIDLRETGDESKRRQLLTSAEIRHFAKTINAVNYFECSAVKNETFAEILQEIATIFFTPARSIKRKDRRHTKQCFQM